VGEPQKQDIWLYLGVMEQSVETPDIFIISWEEPHENFMFVLFFYLRAYLP